MNGSNRKTIEQEVCEIFGWREPNIFVRLVVQAIERIQTGYESHPVSGQFSETPPGRAETAAQLKTQLAMLRQLKEAVQICALARKTFTYLQKQGQAVRRLNAPAAAAVPNKPPTKGEIYRIPGETSTNTVSNTDRMMQMLRMSVIGRQAAKDSSTASK